MQNIGNHNSSKKKINFAEAKKKKSKKNCKNQTEFKFNNLITTIAAKIAAAIDCRCIYLQYSLKKKHVFDVACFSSLKLAGWLASWLAAGIQL